MAGFPCLFATFLVSLYYPSGALRSKSPCPGLGLLSTGVLPHNQVCGGHTQGLGRPGAPGPVPACLWPRTLKLLRMTILPRIKKQKQADNRGASWLPTTDIDTNTGPCGMTQGPERAGVGEGKSQELELPRPCSLENGETRGLFWFPTHMDCLVSSLKYCGLTDMALTIGNGQGRRLSSPK